MTVPNGGHPPDADLVGSLWARLEAWLGGQVRRLLAIHNGGSEVIGGWDLLSADGIAKAYKTIQKYAGEPEHCLGPPHHRWR
jgi:hypothetical protein